MEEYNIYQAGKLMTRSKFHPIMVRNDTGSNIEYWVHPERRESVVLNHRSKKPLSKNFSAKERFSNFLLIIVEY